MRSPSVLSRIGATVVASCLPVAAAVLENPDFETGDLSGWDAAAGPLTAGADTNNTFNRNCAGRLSGSYASDTFVTSSIGQTVAAEVGDDVRALGFVHWKTHDTATASATGWVQATLSGPFATTSRVWQATNSWSFFDLRGKLPGIADSGFESGGLGIWNTTANDLLIQVQDAIVCSGQWAARFYGMWSNKWSWNEVCQFVPLQSGDVVHCSGRMRVDWFQKWDAPLLTSWGAVAGIKLELSNSDFEKVVSACFSNGLWTNLTMTCTITNTGVYTYRAMVCGDVSGGYVESDVYFDELKLWKEGEGEAGASNVTVSVEYVGHSGGASHTSAVDVYVDSWLLQGSTAEIETPTNVLTLLRTEAAAIGTNPLVDIEGVKYPSLQFYGSPGYHTNYQHHPACVEVGIAGWKFREMRKHNVTVTATNTILLYGLSTNGYGFIEFDQYRYVGKAAGKERGEPLELNTNAPYWTLGVRDNSSAEFGEGPFNAEHTYVVGTSLTNFPRRMNTDGSGGWPRQLNIVFEENFSTNAYTNSLWQKHFCLYGIASNGPVSNVKAGKVMLHATKEGVSNDVEVLSQEIHMGWATEDEARGMTDYPNLTYQDHNEVALRAGWLHNLLDRSGWYMAQSPRGSATIEPIDLYFHQAGNWTWRPYEEYLFTWPNAASGVRSIFDEDSVDALPGPASYHVGFKIGHENGTNELGETQYPEVLNVRGCGYYRMTDYDGVMAGSFRPMAADVFGLYGNEEDAPLIPKAYVRLVPRTTPTNEPDDSYAEAYQLIRSKTNKWYVGTLKTQMHFAPGEVASNGCYFDLEVDTWPNKATVITNDGMLACFSQVSMYWRGSSNINDGTEGHDVDCIVVKKTDGEWVTHQVLNPYTNIYQRTLTTFRSNDVIYLMQQDRGRDSYGFATEAPYKRASAFEITMLDDGGLPLSVDVYENSTVSEISDNVNITCQIHKDLAEGEHLHYKYRYRTVYAPGVCLTAPNETCGGENWTTNNRYRIQLYATDGHDEPLRADLYYGNGLDADWRKINTNDVLYVNTNTHQLSYVWDVSGVAPGAYYVKATAQRVSGGKTGFDVSNARLQVGPTHGFPNNGTTNITVTTNAFGYLGTNLSFETGDTSGWDTWGDHLGLAATDLRAYEGDYSLRASGAGWSGWSWNRAQQELPCVSGETIHVTGRVWIQGLDKSGAGWVSCGIKMESTNEAGRTYSEVTFDETSPKGSWLSVDFNRTAPVTGTDRLVLFVCGDSGTNVDVFFDAVVATSTNTGAVVTNGVRTGYWEGDGAVDVTNHNVLSFFAGATYGAAGAEVWVGDQGGTTNRLALSNVTPRLVSLPQRLDVPWTNFPTVNRAQIKAIGFGGLASSNDFAASRMRSTWQPLVARSRTTGSPQVDREGLALFNPGDTVTSVVTIVNLSAAAVTGVSVQAVQEYGETLYWWDESPHVGPLWSAYTRAGDRLCGAYEKVWTNMTIAAGGALTLTNTYAVPLGKRVNHLRNEFEWRDWYFLRNYACRAQVDVTVREQDGDNVFQHQNIGCYAMDDDYDIDNDGLSDEWEIGYGGSYTSLSATADTDGDGRDNMSEYIADTDPTDEDSFPEVASVLFTNGGPARIWFDTVPGRVYWVEWSTSLVNAAWTMLDTNVVEGDGGMMSFLDLESEHYTNRYYKLGLKFSDLGWPL